MLQNSIHYGMHFLVIIGIAYLYDKRHWKKAYLILLATMLVDVDHLLASPIFDPERCSINFHVLHSYWAWSIYTLIAIFSKNYWIRLIAIGLSFHMLTDTVDCWLQNL